MPLTIQKPLLQKESIIESQTFKRTQSHRRKPRWARAWAQQWAQSCLILVPKENRMGKHGFSQLAKPVLFWGSRLVWPTMPSRFLTWLCKWFYLLEGNYNSKTHQHSWQYGLLVRVSMDRYLCNRICPLTWAERTSASSPRGKLQRVPPRSGVKVQSLASVAVENFSPFIVLPWPTKLLLELTSTFLGTWQKRTWALRFYPFWQVNGRVSHQQTLEVWFLGTDEQSVRMVMTHQNTKRPWLCFKTLLVKTSTS